MSNHGKDNHRNEQRVLSLYEKQQLLQYGLSEADFLKKGEMPVEYFTGRVDFAGLTLTINQDVLIPRVESEELVDQALDFAKKCSKQQLRILEIGTGSGAIALAFINKIRQLNYLNKSWEFALTEISAPALATAQNNYQQLLAKDINQDQIKVKFILSNLLEAIKQSPPFDLVLANLPYIPHSAIKSLGASVKEFEPWLALDGGETGFSLIASALEQLLAKQLLADEATIMVETYHLHDQQFIRRNFSFLFGQFEIKFIKDQFNRQRFLHLKKISG